MQTKVKITMEVEFPEPVSFLDIQYAVEEVIAEQLDAKASLIEMSLVDIEELVDDFAALEEKLSQIKSLLGYNDIDLTQLTLDDENFRVLLDKEERLELLMGLKDIYQRQYEVLEAILFDAGAI